MPFASRGVGTSSQFLLLLAFVTGAMPQPVAVALAPIPRSALCITEGAVEELPGGQLSVRAPKMRAYMNHATAQDVETRFTYLGSTDNEARLGSGELRRQFGLKLRAADACNLVYVMWRIEPQSKLAVSLKSNPGQHTSAECSNSGYTNIKPAHATPVPVLREGQSHTLHAVMNGEPLRVWADDRLVWEGNLGPAAASMQGPVGIRSDNARLQLQLFAAELPGRQHGNNETCRSGPQESE
jgi:hypothetical protein